MWFSVLCKMTNGFCCRFSFFEIKVLMRQIVDYCVFFVLNYSWVCAVIHLANVFQLKMTNWWSHESTVQIYPFSGAHGLCVAIGTQRRGTDDLLCLDLFSLCFNLLSRFMETHPVCITHTSLLSFSRSLSFSLSLSLSPTHSLTSLGHGCDGLYGVMHSNFSTRKPGSPTHVQQTQIFTSKRTH